MIKININDLDKTYLRQDEFNEKKAQMQNIFDELVKKYGVSKCKQCDSFICDCDRMRKRPPYIDIGIERVHYTPICPHCKTAMYQPETLLNRYGNELIKEILKTCNDVDELRALAVAILMGFETTLKSYLNKYPARALKAKDIYNIKAREKFYESE